MVCPLNGRDSALWWANYSPNPVRSRVPSGLIVLTGFTLRRVGVNIKQARVAGALDAPLARER